MLWCFLCFCDYSFGGRLFSVERVTARAGESLCVNASNVPLLVGFLGVPADAMIERRAPFQANGDVFEEEASTAGSMPFAFRELHVNGSFVLQAPANESTFTLALITADFCRDGVTFLSGDTFEIELNSELENEFGLRHDEEKCLVVVNDGSTKVRVDVDLVNGVDFVYHYHTLNIYERVTGKARRTFSTLGPDKPMLLRFGVGHSISNRRITVEGSTSGNVNGPVRLLSYGHGVMMTPMPKPTPEVVWELDMGMSMIPMISLIVTGVIFVLVAVAVFVRYRLLTHCFGLDGYTACVEKPLMLPSDFVSANKYTEGDEDE